MEHVKRLWISVSFAFLIAAVMVALVSAAPLSPQARGVALSPGDSREAAAGASVTYAHRITNTTTNSNTQVLSDAFSVLATNSEGWPLEIIAEASPTGTTVLSPVRLGAGESAGFEIRFTVPPNVSGGTVNTTVITATSLSSPTVQAVSRDITTVGYRHIYLPLVVRAYPPAWTQAEDLAGRNVFDIAVCPANPQIQYAGTREFGLYRSVDGGKTWAVVAFDEKLVTPVIARSEGDSTCSAYAAVWGEGVYHVTGDNQVTAINAGLEDLNLYSLALSPDGETLYAGTNNSGVYKTGLDEINWSAIGSYANDDRRIRSLYMIDGELYAGSRACTFYRFDAQDNAEPEVVLAGGCEDEQVRAIAKFGGRLYASLGDKGLYSRPDTGTWQGGDWPRVQDVPELAIYRFGLLPYGGQLYVGTYGDGIYTCDASAVCRKLSNPGLGNLGIRGLQVVTLDEQTYLMAGSDDGIWRVPIMP